MIKRVLVAVLVFAAPVYPVSAQGTKVSVDMIGIGRMSCADWRSTPAHSLGRWPTENPGIPRGSLL